MRATGRALNGLPSNHIYDAVIVGGSVAGSAVAMALAKRGMDVLLCEPGLASHKLLAGELLQAPAAKALIDLGFMDAAWSAGAVASCGIVVVAPDLKAPVVLPYATVPGLHPSGVAIEHATLAAVMLARTSRRRGVTFVAARAQALQDLHGEQAASVELCDDAGSRRVQGRVIIAADGKQSRMRQAAGISIDKGPNVRMCGLKIAGTLPCEGFGHVFLGGRRPVLAYRISGDEIHVVFELAGDTGGVDPRDLDMLPLEVRRRVCDVIARGELSTAVINAMTPHARAKGRLALIGDAGGTVHPISASGVSFALTDALCLAGAMTAHYGDHQCALDVYAREREQPMRTRSVLGEALAETLAGESEAMHALREGLLHYWIDDPANRAASIGLLSTHDGRPAALAKEYGKVALKTIGQLRGRGASWSDTARVGLALGKKALAIARR